MVSLFCIDSYVYGCFNFSPVQPVQYGPTTQQITTRTRDFMFCKWIHEFNWLNSRVSVHEIMSFSRHDTYQWNHTSSDPASDSRQTHSKLMTTGRTCVFTWLHIKTHTGGSVPIMNQYDTCQLVVKWFLVCWEFFVEISPCTIFFI